ncbi:MAG: HNH endonuclease [Gammaproteobacteria bacterium]|nr:HNH endonuclease [Gammaproteobacteria bacterium]MDA7990075.1 HNH endonuclease [Gammaproteobacteria bacterium]MDA8011201.1 HNH endonuclease [Gammaproteobacteria bacterium]MDA8021703.1 HNH endonuclease [Gammaproteobacteria bacterium]
MIKPHTIFTGDNLPILRGMDSESVDLIYLDPPFNSKRTYAAPIGSKAAGAEFKDTWTLADTDDAWWGELADVHPALFTVIDAAGAAGGRGDKAYCIYMAVRLLEMHRALKPGGAIYLHCDQTMSHSIKLMLDAIFGAKNFRNEIIWERAAGRAKGSQHKKKSLGVDMDNVFFYAKTPAHSLHAPFAALSEDEAAEKFPLREPDGRRYNTSVPLFCQPSMGDRPNLCYTYKGVRNPHPSGWRVSREKLAQMDKEGKIIWRKGKRPLRKSYADEYEGKPVGSLWTDIPNVSGRERIGYPTQKPLALLRRIIKTSSDPGGIVLDPFCGCATACVAAHDEGRKWIGIDISHRAYELVQQRFRDELGIFNPGIIHRTDIPQRAGQKRSKNIKHILFGGQQGICKGCKHEFHYRHFHLDHIVPRARGGSDADENLQLLCGSCNNIKGDRTMEYLRARLKELGFIK